MNTVEVWIEGGFTVIILSTGHYEAQVRLAGSNTIRIGRGGSPSEAIGDALN